MWLFFSSFFYLKAKVSLLRSCFSLFLYKIGSHENSYWVQSFLFLFSFFLLWVIWNSLPFKNNYKNNEKIVINIWDPFCNLPVVSIHISIFFSLNIFCFYLTSYCTFKNKISIWNYQNLKEGHSKETCGKWFRISWW